MEESCNIYVHFMRKEIIRTNYTVNIRDAGFTEFYGLVEYDRTDRIYGSNEYDLTLDRI